MIKKKEVGQVFLLVLVLLAIGATLAIQALRLTDTSLKSSQIATRQTQLIYAADTAQEYILWKLKYTDLGAYLMDYGPEAYLTCDTCPISVNLTIIMRAVPGKGGIILATDDIIKPTKEVTPSNPPNTGPRQYTYTILLEQLSDNNSQGLDAVYDVLPKGLNYVPGSSRLSLDGGETWEDFSEPSPYVTGGQVRLRWPDSGYFTSPMRNFSVRQVKKLRFEAEGSLLNNRVYYNWVLLKVGDIDTLSGPQAPITLGNGTQPEGGLLSVSKASDPDIIPPGVLTDIYYTIAIKNMDGETHQLQEISDYLPPGFTYDNQTAPSGLTNLHPHQLEEVKNGVERLHLLWSKDRFPQGNAVSIASGENLTLSFWAKTTKDVSGSYYNEVTITPNTPIPPIFRPPDMDVTYEDYNSTYSWNSGVVTVPTYDSRADAEGIVLDSNLALVVGGVSITSYQMR